MVKKLMLVMRKHSGLVESMPRVFFGDPRGTYMILGRSFNVMVVWYIFSAQALRTAQTVSYEHITQRCALACSCDIRHMSNVNKSTFTFFFFFKLYTVF